MSKPVVLVLGNDAFATRVAELARDAGNIVALASPIAKETDKIRTIKTDPSSHDSLLAAFQSTLDAYGRINAVLAAFVPQPAAKDAIPGADQTALHTALDPSVRVAKIVLHHVRRTVGDKSIAWLAVSGDDIMSQTAAGAITGIFRSLLARLAAQSTYAALVRSYATDEATARALVSCIRSSDTADFATHVAAPKLPKRFNAKMLMVENGTVTVSHPLQGSPSGFQYDHVFARLAGLIMLSEDGTRRKINGATFRFIASIAVIVGVTLIARRFGFIGRLSSPFN